ncbi:phosphatase PAP2 family protein [Arthrobacter sp. STN4]|uniref:phosphatase PAP2 family protein n=1 Tax=Arthrobacter sp. STN4 TaxID=2923276 RepID=UPI00211A9A67|nr:phosphatase PAP2 family protein [Arthrobacter sp. STN4]MCQ9163941.1 phosphatase PAP2 family protein [Arthrobacter sp. STN4]
MNRNEQRPQDQATHGTPQHPLGRPDDDRARLLRLPQIRHWIMVPALLSVLIIALGLTAKTIPGITSGELAVDQDLSRHHDGFLNVLGLAINTILGPAIGVAIVAAVFLFLLLVRRSPVNATAVAAVAAVGWLSSQVFKVIVARQRPNPAALFDPLAPETGSNSFPSGHTCLATALVIAFWFLARNTRWEKPVAILGAVFALGVGLSRLYVGVHYPSDILASFLVPCAAILFFTGLWNRYAAAVLPRIPLLSRFGPVPAAGAVPAK